MNNLRGGRGNKAPYEQTHMRIPLPLKPFIEAIVHRYRVDVIGGNNNPQESVNRSIGYQVSIDLVDSFIEEERIEQLRFEKPTLENQNLKCFYDWLVQSR